MQTRGYAIPPVIHESHESIWLFHIFLQNFLNVFHCSHNKKVMDHRKLYYFSS